MQLLRRSKEDQAHLLLAILLLNLQQVTEASQRGQLHAHDALL